MEQGAKSDKLGKGGSHAYLHTSKENAGINETTSAFRATNLGRGVSFAH